MTNIVVIKLGSNALLNQENSLDLLFIENIASQISKIAENNCIPIIVSSGAVACGMDILGLKEKPTVTSEKQALAAVGQARLINYWQDAFSKFQKTAAQLLLTADDFSDRERYLNLRETIHALFDKGVIPIVNENDSVAVEALRVGDNDNLSAIIASQLNAEKLLLLTDVDGVYNGNPKTTDAKKYDELGVITPELLDEVKGESTFGTGGMESKLLAARIARRAGVDVSIADAREDSVICKILNGEKTGTIIKGTRDQTGKKRWLGSASTPLGTIIVDKGAENAMKNYGASLLPVGIKEVQGDFKEEDLVSIMNLDGEEIARGLAQFSSKDLIKLKGKNSKELAEIIGKEAKLEAVHRDNMIIE